MSEESPHFNERFMQEDNKDQYNLDFNLLAEEKEHGEEFDRKIVGFDSIDDLFSSLGSAKLKQGISKDNAEVIGQQQAMVLFEQKASKHSASRLPNITINYSKQSVRNSSINHNGGTLPAKEIEIKSFKKKVVEYPFKQRAAQSKVQQQRYSFLERIKPEPSVATQNNSNNRLAFLSNFQNPNNLNNQHRNTLKNIQNRAYVRFVTCDSYDYRQRILFLNKLDSKMQFLRQLQAKILNK